MKKFFLFNFTLILIIGIAMMGRYFMGGQNGQKQDTSAPSAQALTDKQTSTDKPASSKTIYNWTDKNGVEHITTSPPPENVKIKHKTTYKRASSEKAESDSTEQTALSKMLKKLPEKTASDGSEKDIISQLQKASPEKAESDNAQQDTLSRMLKVWEIFKSVVISSKKD